MRRLSLTLAWPMNAASRWGLSESSTTDSSARDSGVVISARVTVIPARKVERTRQDNRWISWLEQTPKDSARHHDSPLRASVVRAEEPRLGDRRCLVPRPPANDARSGHVAR